MTIARRSLLLGLALFAAASGVRAQEKLPVVASFSILGDLVSQVGGDRVAVRTLVGPNGDAHVYQPTPSDARALAEAKLVIVNGLEFEGWMPRLLRSSQTKATMITASEGIQALPSEEAAADEGDHKHDHAHKHDHDHHDHGAVDPHAWHSIENVKTYVRNIAAGLSRADAAGASLYAANAERYLAALEALAAETAAAFAAVPKENRRIITSHDAFGYLAATYDLEILSPVGVSTDDEPTPGDLARLIRQVNAENVRAVFVENIADRRIIDQIARETGAKVGGRLYSDALSAADGPASDYIALMRHNVTTIVDALKR
jgi:zinc/manganese transport system substrate-binding protein